MKATRALLAAASAVLVVTLPPSPGNPERLFNEAERLREESSAESLHLSLDAYRAARAGFRARGDPGGEGRSASGLAWSHEMLGDLGPALAAYEESLPLLRAAGDRKEEASALQGLGAVKRYLGDLDGTIAANEQAIAIQTAIGAPTAGSYNNLGVAYWHAEEHQKALDAYAEALRTFRAEGNRHGEGFVLNNLGSVYRTLGDATQALDHHRAALEIRRALDDQKGAGNCIHNIGLVEQQILLDPTAARASFAEALVLRQQTGDRSGEAWTREAMGVLLLDAGDPDGAVGELETAVGLWRNVGGRLGQAGALAALGRAHAARGDVEAARNAFRESLALARETRDRSSQVRALSGLARLERDNGRLEEALRAAEACLEIVESVRSGVVSPDLRASYRALVDEYYELYVDLLMRRHESEPGMGHDARALAAAERGRARVLYESLVSARGLVLGDAALAVEVREAEREVRSEVHRAEKSGMGTAALEAAERRYAEVEDRRRAADPRYAALVSPAGLGPDELERLLDDDTTLVVFALGTERSFAWLLKHGERRSAVLPDKARLQDLSRRAHEALERRRPRAGEAPGERRRREAQADDDFEARARELSEALFGPLASHLRGSHLVIVPDGALSYVPFAALPAPAPDAPALRELDIVRLPSLSVLPLLQSAADSTESRVAIFADPVFEDDDPRLPRASPPTTNARAKAPSVWSRLPYASAEADAIASLVPKDQLLLRTGLAATRAGVLAADLTPYAVVHFATHGVFDSEWPDRSGLQLSARDETGSEVDGFLGLKDVYGLKLRADLVVLSACRTGLGRAIRGEGHVGLTRGFFHAGARRVLASLWSVEDEATAALMGRFYEERLRRRQAPAAALRVAREAVRRDPRWSSPYYWAGFELEGDWR